MEDFLLNELEQIQKELDSKLSYYKKKSISRELTKLIEKRNRLLCDRIHYLIKSKRYEDAESVIREISIT